MITQKQARAALHAFAWTNGDDFKEAYEAVYGHEVRWDAYMDDQFRMMQNKPLDFIIKWNKLAAQIIAVYMYDDEVAQIC